MIGAYGSDLRDDHAEIVARKRLDRGLAEAEHRIGRGHVRDPGTRCDRCKIGDSRRGVRRESSGRKEAPVVEDEVHEIPRPVPRERRERAEIHQNRTVAIEDDNLLVWQVQGDPEANLLRQSHRVLQIKEVVAVAEIVEFLGARAHDRHNDFIVQLRIEHPDAFGALHSASSMRSRVRSSATGDSELCENVYASRICRPTSFGLRAYSNGMFNARRTPSVTMPPRVCQGYGSPQWPRSAINMHSGML